MDSEDLVVVVVAVAAAKTPHPVASTQTRKSRDHRLEPSKRQEEALVDFHGAHSVVPLDLAVMQRMRRMRTGSATSNLETYLRRC